MNDNDLRQILLADPKSNDARVQQALAEDARLRTFAAELLKQDQQFADAMQVPLPPLLSEKLINLPSVAKKNPRRWFIPLAMAASMSVLAVLGVQWFQTLHYGTDLGSHALAHVRYEHDHLLAHAAAQPLQEVNSKLANFNAVFQNWQDDIIYARYCTFQGTRSLHLAVKTATGYATIFIVPKEAELEFVAEFADAQYKGLSLAMPGANVIVVSSNPADLQQLPQKLSDKLIFQA